ncbi:hypothetical protein Glove_443g69 [Diversispora epigaea]|uniref:Ricin B lectin domain-containing protein n=1 Tax=Diversispora epigaea TaxID=1348612 RepID=A0A397GQG4_9GLOM|nr:hypothetical protein Glove_443g69 [Diversispora epigaea]
MNFNIVLILIFSISILRECSSFPSFPHIQGGPSVPKLLTNTIENKYHWKCLDASSDPLYVLECNKQPSQTRFSLEIPHQSYHNCERPIKIFGQSNTII